MSRLTTQYSLPVDTDGPLRRALEDTFSRIIDQVNTGTVIDNETITTATTIGKTVTLVDPSSTPTIVATLAPAIDWEDRVLYIRNVSKSGVAHVVPQTGELIDSGTATYGVLPSRSLALISDGSGWHTVSSAHTPAVYNVKDFGAVGDNVVNDSTAFNSTIAMAIARKGIVHIPYGAYYLQQRLTFSARCDVTCNNMALMRWDGTSANVGILLDFDGTSTGQLCEMNFPCLFGPAINSSFALPGYGTNTQDGSTRVGTGIHVHGGDRLTINAHIINSFGTAFLAESSATNTVDNVNFNCNTSDFCEKFIHLDCDSGSGTSKGIAQFVGRANTVWAKFPIYIDSTFGYINAANIDILGTAFTNELGGCGIYVKGDNLRSSKLSINQIQAGWRSDSHTSTPYLLTPTGAMDATPVQGETITQTTSGATGVVVTNADQALSTSLPFTVQTVTGTFTTTSGHVLTGSTSGALGANSLPSSVRGLVSPWLGGDQTMNSVTYDVEQTGTIGYNGSTYCEFTFGAPMDHPTALNHGAFSVQPVAGESVRIRDNGKHNRIYVRNSYASTVVVASAVTLSSSSGEANFNGGVGSALWGDWVYCYVSADSLAAGATLTRYLYHSKVSDNQTLQPVDVVFKNTGASNRNSDVNIIAYSNGETNNRQITVFIKNISSSDLESTQNLYFYLKLE